MKQRHLKLIVVVLLIGFLAACSTNAPQTNLETQSLGIFYNLKRLRPTNPNDLTFANQQNNCVTFGFSMPGQGARLNGSTGGMGYDPITTPQTTPNAEGTRLRNSFFTGLVPNQNAHVLVVDDFGPTTSPRFTLRDELFAVGATNATVQSLIDSNLLTHGPMVFEHLLRVVQGTGVYPTLSTVNASTREFRHFNSSTFTFSTLRAQGVNVRNPLNPVHPLTNKPKITTQDVVNALLPRLNAIGTPVVVNMSFVILPCELEEDFIRWDATHEPAIKNVFEQYIEALANRNSPLYFTNFNNQVDTVDTVVNGVLRKGEITLVNEIIAATDGRNGTAILTDDDPLLRLIRDHITESSRQNIYVGASGNYGLARSMNPADWANAGVISVTGSSVDIPRTAVNERTVRTVVQANIDNDPELETVSLFNRGEVMAVGASLRFNRNNRNLFYTGTSYSTPTVSAYSAIDVAITQRCAELGLQFKSELAIDTVALVDRALENNSQFPLFIPGAVPTRCGAN